MKNYLNKYKFYNESQIPSFLKTTYGRFFKRNISRFLCKTAVDVLKIGIENENHWNSESKFAREFPKSVLSQPAYNLLNKKERRKTCSSFRFQLLSGYRTAKSGSFTKMNNWLVRKSQKSLLQRRTKLFVCLRLTNHFVF